MAESDDLRKKAKKFEEAADKAAEAERDAKPAGEIPL